MRSTLKCDIIQTYIVGDELMKTKIIYISGNEVFEMSEIRAAFDSVRVALGLDDDTILFGVPVDCDNALSNTDAAPITEISATEPVINPVATPVTESVIEPVTAVIEPVTEKVQEIQPATTEPVVPILSILSAQEGDTTEPAAKPADTQESTTEPVVENVAETAIISDVNVNLELATVIDQDDEAAVETITIGDMITDDAPIPQMEKTLEELLETMAPLREDVHPVVAEHEVADNVFKGDDTDATLAQLATEFVDNQDKIPSATRTSNTSKIGKLKNILPFKKAKRDDNGSMGDLFGWAGIAANDEDFSIPGFFTPATSKKQGA